MAPEKRNRKVNDEIIAVPMNGYHAHQQ